MRRRDAGRRLQLSLKPCDAFTTDACTTGGQEFQYIERHHADWSGGGESEWRSSLRFRAPKLRPQWIQQSRVAGLGPLLRSLRPGYLEGLSQTDRRFWGPRGFRW